ncbi:hypothetical protein HYH02_008236 [Chlamydomonas schloesseri]|uniref:Uncharacterized protein n=1 Tax=Chlamydomonas schloesseri TaxID=2026947 RepID=A0A835WFX1_9CHLO|nr:hypothetical protein HYH02_008236 [Chlamydomonas schloesseri]|eukprot:KAG2446666.1 hypothetical protein HYH02_008236 [Chlamydomonas schloesseri]
MRSQIIAALVVLLAVTGEAARVQPHASLDAPVRASPFTCVKQKTAIDCDLLSDCVWCIKNGSSMGTGCYPISAAKLIPKKWGIECDKPLDGSAAEVTAGDQEQQAEAAVQATCDGKPEATCIGPACVWCTSAAVGGGCYTPEEAKKLPGSIFKCKTSPSVILP